MHYQDGRWVYWLAFKNVFWFALMSLCSFKISRSHWHCSVSTTVTINCSSNNDERQNTETRAEKWRSPWALHSSTSPLVLHSSIVTFPAFLNQWLFISIYAHSEEKKTAIFIEGVWLQQHKWRDGGKNTSSPRHLLPMATSISEVIAQ